MCVGVPARIDEINADMAIADVLGVKTEISVALIKDIQVGNYVMLHAGVAISKISEEEATSTIEIMRELGEILNERS